MKKVLAVLLAVLMTFSFVTLAVSAEDGEGPVGETGTTYTYAAGLHRINAATDGEVIILQAGDKIEFEALTSTKKAVNVIYYPDCASITATNVKNVDWRDVKVAQYNLDTTKWVPEITDKAERESAISGMMAKSPMKYKTFTATYNFVKGDVVAVDVLGMGDEAVAKDSAGVVRAEAGAIDYKLDGATFVGWALYKYSTWNKSNTTAVTIEVYALWDRDAAPEEGPVGPVEESDDPIVNFMNKILGYIEIASGWVRAVPALLSAGVAMILDGGLKNWLYKIFKIEA